jgi:hypothetical protein
LSDQKTLLATIEDYESQSRDGVLTEDRVRALDYYLGNPLGNEIEGRSGVISRDVWDTVEWVKPQIADIFCSGDQVVAFSPQNKEDVQAAEQETEYINYVITQKNDWFPVFYNWSHDALLQRTGYVVAYFDEGELRNKEKYKDLTDEEFRALLSDPNAVPVEHTIDDFGRHTVTIERVKPYGCAKIENIAPENVIVSDFSRNLSLQDPRLDFCEYWQHKTISELREDGFDVDDDLTDASDSNTGDYEDSNRDPLGRDSDIESSPATRRLKVRNVWIRYDEDEDGIAELRKVIVVGNTILENEECEFVTLVALCPCPLPHQHTGLSLADAVKDLQLIKTALLRGGLDNQYLANNGRHAIDENLVNLDDMLTSRPGGVVRVKGPPSQAIFPLTHAVTGDAAVGMMEYIDRTLVKRTGVNEQSQGLDPNSLQNKTLGAAQIYQSAAQQRIKFIARIFAETGVKNLFQVVHALTLRHARQPDIMELRNQWIPVDPRLWGIRKDMKISVALGSGDKPQQIMFLDQLLQKQIAGLQMGLSDPAKLYNTVKRQLAIAGFKDAEEFFTDPSTQQPKPSGPPPEVMAEQAKAQSALMLEQMKSQTTKDVEQLRAQLKLQEIRANLELQAANDQRDSQREILKAQFDAELEKQKLAMEEWATQLQAKMDKYKNDQDNSVKLQIAGIQAASATENNVIGIEGRKQEAQAKQQIENKPKEDANKSVDAVGKALSELTKLTASVAKGQEKLAEVMSRPKKVVRDDEGRIVGTE